MKSSAKSKEAILAYIEESLEDRGYPPSVREICAAVGLSSPSTVHNHLKALAKQGAIELASGKKRAISLPGESSRKDFVPVPLLGAVTAGVPILAQEERLGFVPVLSGISRGRELFALTVRGDSMIGAGILDGDVVIVQKTPCAEDGDIVVALLEDEATVKRFFREKNGFRLQPENDSFEPIYTREMTILGKVISLLRNLE